MAEAQITITGDAHVRIERNVARLTITIDLATEYQAMALFDQLKADAGKGVGIWIEGAHDEG